MGQSKKSHAEGVSSQSSFFNCYRPWRCLKMKCPTFPSSKLTFHLSALWSLSLLVFSFLQQVFIWTTAAKTHLRPKCLNYQFLLSKQTHCNNFQQQNFWTLSPSCDVNTVIKYQELNSCKFSELFYFLSVPTVNSKWSSESLCLGIIFTLNDYIRLSYVLTGSWVKNFKIVSRIKSSLNRYR